MLFMLTLRQILSFLGWCLTGDPISSSYRLEIIEFMQSWGLLCVKLNDQMNTGNFARHSFFFFINQVKKSPLLKASKFLFYFCFSFYLSLTLLLLFLFSSDRVRGAGVPNCKSCIPDGVVRLSKIFWHLCGLSHSYRTLFSLYDIWVVKSLSWLY